MRGALYAERFSPCAAVGAGCGGRGAPGGVCGAAESLARGFVERYRDRFERAVEVFAQGLGEALTYLDFPSGHQRHIKSTNVLERLIREVKRRTGGWGLPR